VYRIRQFDPVHAARLEELQRVRAVVYGLFGLEDPTKFVDGRYIDNDDWDSKHITASTFDGEREGPVVGGITITPRRRNRPLKLEETVAPGLIEVPRGVHAVEMVRLAVLPEHQRTGVFLGLWQEAFQYVRDKGVELVFALQRPGVVPIQERIGLPVERLSAPVIGQNGLSLIPTLIRVSEVLPTLASKNPKMGPFFDRPLPDGAFDRSTSMEVSPAELTNFEARFARRPQTLGA
jgi:GNAT superfamily N-acetyltransferase